MPRTPAKHRGRQTIHTTRTPVPAEDGDAASSPPSEADLASSHSPVRRTATGQFIDGPSAGTRRLAAIRRSAGVRQRRYLVTKGLLDHLTHGDIECHLNRMCLIIEEGTAKDAVAAFRTLYGLLAVPPSEDTRLLAELQAGAAPGDGKATPPTVIVMPSPPERLLAPPG